MGGIKKLHYSSFHIHLPLSPFSPPMPPLPSITTIGAATRDVFLASPAFQVIRSSQFIGGKAECMTLGAKIDVESCVFSTGGGATNAAVTFAQLGFSPSIITKIGNDEPGRDIVTELKRAGVNCANIRVDKKGQTSYSTILTTSDGERTILVFRGVSVAFSSTDIPTKALAGDWVYITSLGGNVELLEKIIDFCKKKKISIACNPGAGELKKAASLRRILRDVDILLVNKEEAQMLSAKASKDASELCLALADGPSYVVVTDGPQGACAWHDKKLFFVRALDVASISQTGAGDAFGSGFVAGVMKSDDVITAMQIATLNAASVVQHVGAKTGILRSWPSAKACKAISVREVRMRN